MLLLLGLKWLFEWPTNWLITQQATLERRTFWGFISTCQSICLPSCATSSVNAWRSLSNVLQNRMFKAGKQLSKCAFRLNNVFRLIHLKKLYQYPKSGLLIFLPVPLLLSRSLITSFLPFSPHCLRKRSHRLEAASLWFHLKAVKLFLWTHQRSRLKPLPWTLSLSSHFFLFRFFRPFYSISIQMQITHTITI